MEEEMNQGEIIEELAKKLERIRILDGLKGCQTLEEYRQFTKELQAIVDKDFTNR